MKYHPLTILLLLLFSSFNLYAQLNIEVTSEVSRDNKGYDFRYTKQKYGTYSLKLFFTSSDNISMHQTAFVLKSPSGILTNAKRIDETKPSNFRYTYRYARGYISEKVDSTFTYILPFKKGIKTNASYLYNVREKYFGEDIKTWTALHFLSKNPDTVCAIRKGMVVEVIDKYATDMSASVSYSSERNSILVEHADGTLASYNGFDSSKIFVKEGDTVFPNQPLGALAPYDKDKDYQLRLMIYYLTKFDSKEDKQTNNYSYYNPVFLIDGSPKKLENFKNYTSEVSDEIIQKEMSKKELKRFLKK